jgi:hypothetical protein
MKRLIFMGIALALVVGLIWVPAVAAGEADIIIHKAIDEGCPEETFHFEAWRDMNGNGVIDAGDTLQGTVDITGAGTGVITVGILGKYVVREVLEVGSIYEPHPDQPVFIACDEHVYFDNTCEFELCDLVILKTDTAGDPLSGACFTITPDPRTGTDSLVLCDNDGNDECPADGVFCLSDLICGLTVTVEETTVPDGYQGADPQTAIIGETVELTFVNTKCELTIYKVDGSGDPLSGACFTITPDPRTGTDSLVLCDNDANDECPADGVFCLSELICGLTVTVEETTVPDGYQGAAEQTVTIGETVELTFENTREMDCGTVCAAQTAPGEFLFDEDKQENWFTWIHYDIGDGTVGDPYTYPIYMGQTTLCGTLYVYDDGTHVFVNYALTDTATCTLAGLSEYHLQVDETFDDLKKAVFKGKNPVPGKCEYKDAFDPMVPETGYIECTDDDISGWTTAYIFAHGVGCYYCP